MAVAWTPSSSTATLNDTIVAGNVNTRGAAASSAGSPRDVTGGYDLIGPGGSGGIANGSERRHRPDRPHLPGPGPPGQLRRTDPDDGLAAGQRGPRCGDEPGLLLQRSAQLPPRLTPTRYRHLPGSELVGAPDRHLDRRRRRRATRQTGSARCRGPGRISEADTTIIFDPTVFAAAETITLSQDELDLTNARFSTTIGGPTAPLTISGGGGSGVFRIQPNVTATLSGLTITDVTSPAGCSTTARRRSTIARSGATPPVPAAVSSMTAS